MVVSIKKKETIQVLWKFSWYKA